MSHYGRFARSGTNQQLRAVGIAGAPGQVESRRACARRGRRDRRGRCDSLRRISRAIPVLSEGRVVSLAARPSPSLPLRRCRSAQAAPPGTPAAPSTASTIGSVPRCATPATATRWHRRAAWTPGRSRARTPSVCPGTSHIPELVARQPARRTASRGSGSANLVTPRPAHPAGSHNRGRRPGPLPTARASRTSSSGEAAPSDGPRSPRGPRSRAEPRPRPA